MRCQALLTDRLEGIDAIPDCYPSRSVTLLVEDFFSFNTPFPFLLQEQASRFAMRGDDKGLALTDQRKESAQAATGLTLAERFIHRRGTS